MFGLSVLEVLLLLVVVWLWITGGIFCVYTWGYYHGKEADMVIQVVIMAVWPIVVFWASFGVEDDKVLKKEPDTEAQPPF